MVNPRDGLSNWLFKVCLVLSCIHAHHLTANSCLGSRFTNPLLLRLRNTTLLGGQVASHFWELGYGCVIDRMPADHPPVSRSMPWYRPLWDPLVSFLRSPASVLVWWVILNFRDSLLLWLKKRENWGYGCTVCFKPLSISSIWLHTDHPPQTQWQFDGPVTGDCHAPWDTQKVLFVFFSFPATF